jgi:hypothetical protein
MERQGIFCVIGVAAFERYGFQNGIKSWPLIHELFVKLNSRPET